MALERTSYSDLPVASASRKFPERLNPVVVEQVERLLNDRTRNIRLNGELADLFRDRSWRQTAKIVRAWMTWVIVLDILTLSLNALLLPSQAITSMLFPSLILPPAALVTVITFRKQRQLWLEAAIVLTSMFLILLSVALVGVNAGGEFYERHLTIMLFVAVTAIVIFPVPIGWATAIAAFALGLYLVFQLRNPAIEAGSAFAGSLFFASGVAATIVARRTATLLAQKAFLLELRDRSRLVDLADANTRLELLARTDPLTGVANRRWMTEILERFWKDGHIQEKRAAVLMCDVDDFKRLNDSLGHAEGDRCLVKIAGIIQSCMSDELFNVARYGGEEFFVFLPGADQGRALDIAEHIRGRVEAASLPNPSSRVLPYVTLSIGVAAMREENIPPEEIQRRADGALYRAKESGRNCVKVHIPIN